VDVDRLAIWRDDMRAAVDAVVHDFEARFGFPAGDNLVEEPDGAARERLAAIRPAVPHDLVVLHSVVGEVNLTDVGNGLFLHSAAQVVEHHESAWLRRVSGRHAAEVVVFASDGGGTLYALASPAGSPVYRLPPDEVLHGVYESRNPLFEAAAPDLAGFLDRALEAVRVFAATGMPTDL
jgi:hypothetical protein